MTQFKLQFTLYFSFRVQDPRHQQQLLQTKHGIDSYCMLLLSCVRSMVVVTGWLGNQRQNSQASRQTGRAQNQNFYTKKKRKKKDSTASQPRRLCDMLSYRFSFLLLFLFDYRCMFCWILSLQQRIHSFEFGSCFTTSTIHFFSSSGCCFFFLLCLLVLLLLLLLLITLFIKRMKHQLTNQPTSHSASQSTNHPTNRNPTNFFLLISYNKQNTFSMYNKTKPHSMW